MTDQIATYTTWAHCALAQYDIGECDLAFRRHNDNLTFRVVECTRPNRYLLRIHLPLSASFAGIRQQPAAIISELRWLEALARDTILTVQVPVGTIQDGLIAMIHSGGRDIPCTLLRWIDGAALNPDAPEAARYAEQLGRVVALLHEHARSWAPPADFVRPSYDLEYFRRQMTAFDDGVSAGLIAPQDYDVLLETSASILTLLAEIETDHSSWGLTHSDLHPGNYLVYQREVRPIDFSLCGFGYLLFDLGTVLAGHKPALRQPFLDGYSHHQRLHDSDLRLLEAFCLLSRMGAYAFMLPNPAEQDWLRARIPRFVANECRRFRYQEPLLFEM